MAVGMTSSQGITQTLPVLVSGSWHLLYRLAAQKRAEERRQARRAEKQQQRLGPVKEKLAEYKAKEDATMEMLRKMAEERKNRGAF